MVYVWWQTKLWVEQSNQQLAQSCLLFWAWPLCLTDLSIRLLTKHNCFPVTGTCVRDSSKDYLGIDHPSFGMVFLGGVLVLNLCTLKKMSEFCWNFTALASPSCLLQLHEANASCPCPNLITMQGSLSIVGEPNKLQLQRRLQHAYSKFRSESASITVARTCFMRPQPCLLLQAQPANMET